MKVSLPRSLDKAFNKAMQSLETIFQGRIGVSNLNAEIKNLTVPNDEDFVVSVSVPPVGVLLLEHNGAQDTTFSWKWLNTDKISVRTTGNSGLINLKILVLGD